MQDINELLRVLEQHHIRLPQPSTEERTNDSTVDRLLKGIQLGQYATDADASSDLFPGASAENSGYHETRTALRVRLTRAIEHFIAELERYPDVQQAHFECQKLWLNVRTLSGQNAAVFALDLATHILRIAEKFDFTLLGMDVAQYLRLQYCSRGLSDELCADADTRYLHFQQVLEAEFQAEKMYTELMALSVANSTPYEELHRLATAYSDHLAPVLRKYSSSKLHLYGNLIILQHHCTAQDFSGALHRCEKAIRFFQGKPYNARDPLQIFYYQMLVCSIHLRQIKAGDFAVRACLELVGENNFNAFKIKELFLILQLHTKQYDEALATFSEMVSDPQFTFLPETYKANWGVYEAYLAFLVSNGTTSVPQQAGAFAGKYMQSRQVSPSSAGLVIDFIHLLQTKQYDAARDRLPDLELHCKAVSERIASRRSILFLNMLMQIPVANFRRTASIPLAGRFLAQLRETPLQLANQTYEFEVVPFENLWELVLQTLEP